MSDPAMYRVLAIIKKDKGLAAALRRGVTRPIGEMPEVWFLLAQPEWQKNSNSQNDSIYRTLCLYALHLQSANAQNGEHHTKNKQEGCVGGVLAKLDVSDSVKRRFLKIMGSRTRDELLHTLGSLVRLLHKDHVPIPLNYDLLANDIYKWGFVDSRADIQQRWGNAYARAVMADQDLINQQKEKANA